MELEELITELISEGLSPMEAAKVAAATIRAEKKAGSIAKREVDLTFPASPQNDGRRAVDYGNETPQQARERWEEQERNDPQGVFSGGMSGGGVFGQGAVATDTYDPEAMGRTLGIQERVQNQRVQAETLKTLQQMQERMGELPPPQQQQRRRFAPAESFGRLLGKKKNR